MLQLARNLLAIVHRDEPARGLSRYVVDEHAQQATGALVGVDQVVAQACHGVFDGTLPIHQKQFQPCNKNRFAKKNGLEESAQSFQSFGEAA